MLYEMLGQRIDSIVIGREDIDGITYTRRFMIMAGMQFFKEKTLIFILIIIDNY